MPSSFLYRVFLTAAGLVIDSQQSHNPLNLIHFYSQFLYGHSALTSSSSEALLIRLYFFLYFYSCVLLSRLCLRRALVRYTLRLCFIHTRYSFLRLNGISARLSWAPLIVRHVAGLSSARLFSLFSHYRRVH